MSRLRLVVGLDRVLLAAANGSQYAIFVSKTQVRAVKAPTEVLQARLRWWGGALTLIWGADQWRSRFRVSSARPRHGAVGVPTAAGMRL